MLLDQFEYRFIIGTNIQIWVFQLRVGHCARIEMNVQSNASIVYLTCLLVLYVTFSFI